MQGFGKEEWKEMERMGELLFSAGVDEKTAVIISMMVRRPGARLKLIQWMEDNRQADAEEIISKAQELRAESIRANVNSKRVEG